MDTLMEVEWKWLWLLVLALRMGFTRFNAARRDWEVSRSVEDSRESQRWWFGGVELPRMANACDAGLSLLRRCMT